MLSVPFYYEEDDNPNKLYIQNKGEKQCWNVFEKKKELFEYLLENLEVNKKRRNIEIEKLK